jgi:hypothetical protein
MTREEFEHAFASRTLAYHPDYRADDRPVVVLVGASAHSAPGHALTVALVNLLARAHRRLVISGDLRVPLRCRDHFGCGTLEEATLGLARAINPFIDVRNSDVTIARPLLTLGIGVPADMGLGCDGWCAEVGEGARIDPRPTSLLGAASAACLGAATAFHWALGHPEVPAGVWSLWESGRCAGTQGPDLCGPVDVGRVLQVGAGAVGCALAYWLDFCGFAGEWVLVDGDLVDVTNLNRQLLFIAADAGFPEGPARNKAEVLASRMAGPVRPSNQWYGMDSGVVESVYDLVLPLANERGARSALQRRAQTVLLHATTTPNWRVIAHRHVAGRDGCLTCRLPEEPAVNFSCSTAQVGLEKRTDASLPFLSASAGLLLLGDLIRLQHGRLLERSANFTALDLATPNPSVSALIFRCQEGCHGWMHTDARLKRTAGSRFAYLDGSVERLVAKVPRRRGA